MRQKKKIYETTKLVGETRQGTETKTVKLNKDIVRYTISCFLL